MFRYLIDWPFIAILVAFNMVRIAEQVYMILYSKVSLTNPNKLEKRYKMPIYKAKGSCYNNNRRPSRRTNLASLTRLGKHSLPLGLLSLRPSLRRWLTKCFFYFRKRRKWSIVIPFFTQSCLRSCFELGGGYLMAAGPFEIYCSIASTKILVRISKLENNNPSWFSPSIHF